MKQNLIPLSDLNLTDRFLFDEVMEDPQAHQDALSIIFGHTVPLLTKMKPRKNSESHPPFVQSVWMFVQWTRIKAFTTQRCRKNVRLI